MGKYSHDFAERSTRALSRALKQTADVKKFFDGKSLQISGRLKEVKEKWNKIYFDEKLGMANASMLEDVKVESARGSKEYVSLLDADIKELIDAKTEFISGFDLSKEQEKEFPKAITAYEAQVKDAIGYHKLVAELARGQEPGTTKAKSNTREVQTQEAEV